MDEIGNIIKEFIDLREEILERELKIKEVEGKAITIIGPRRAGKTYFQLFYFQKYRDEGKNVIYFPFDDDRIYPPTLKTIQDVIKVSKEFYPEGKIYFFFDEIQEVEKWELAVKRLVERENCYVFLTGSSSKLLSKEIATQLRGRSISYEIFPFSFKEITKLKNIKLEKYFTEREQAKIRRLLKDYLFQGGFPEIWIKGLRNEILKEYFNLIIYRDLVERWKIRNYKALRLFLKMAINNFSSKFSVNSAEKYMKNMKLEVSRNTLYNYLEYSNDAYILFPLRKFSFSLKEVEQSLPKIYIIDNGLIKILSSGSENYGRLMENIVFLQLRRKYKENKSIFYFETKEGYEVDFIVKEDLKVKQLIQVTYASARDEIEQREIKALVKAFETFKKDKPELLIITWDYEDEMRIGNLKIKCIPLYNYLIF